jgi:hypothetical protein
MGHTGRRVLRCSICVAALTLVLLLSGCGASSSTTVGQSAEARTEEALAQATPVNTATNQPYATVPISPQNIEQPGCPAVGDGSVPPLYEMVDGLKVSIPQRWASLDFQSELMPNNLPTAPYKVPLTATQAQDITTFHPNPPVNPSLDTGYAVEVCNVTSASQTVTSLSVTITSFTPSSGPVTVWHLCQDGPYDTATKSNVGGCGGSAGITDSLAATLPGDRTGASAPAIANANGGGPTPPFAIDPNQSIVFLIAVDGLTSQGTYSLSFGLSIDGSAPTTLAPSDGAFLIAPAAIIWTGTACQTPAMLAQIPAASQDTYYVCPPAS